MTITYTDNTILESIKTPSGTYKMVTVQEAINELNASTEQIDIALKQQQPKIPTNELRAKLITTLDIEAGKIRDKIVSKGSLVEEEYRLAWEEAIAWQTKKFAGDPPMSVAIWLTNNDKFEDAKSAAQDIIDTRAQFTEALLLIREIRLRGKYAITNALPKDLQLVGDTAIAEMRNAV